MQQSGWKWPTICSSLKLYDELGCVLSPFPLHHGGCQTETGQAYVGDVLASSKVDDLDGWHGHFQFCDSITLQGFRRMLSKRRDVGSEKAMPQIFQSKTSFLQRTPQSKVKLFYNVGLQKCSQHTSIVYLWREEIQTHLLITTYYI